MKIKPIIISISSHSLNSIEKKIIKKEKPWGIILFKRNIKNLNQAKKLIQSIKNITMNSNFPILIDEEGGRVSRLSNFIYNSNFSQHFFGDLYKSNNSVGLQIYKNYINSICNILNDIGVNINTVPVLDLFQDNAHKIVGNRSFSKNVKNVKILADHCIYGYKKNKIGTVVKHIPGHGRATSDSHKKLPIVNTNYKTLLRTDFKCFMETKSFFAMTAHILYKKIDPKNVSTHSEIIIKKIIRKKIGFRGLIISDDVSMKALKFNIFENAKRALDAGCNLVLYCEGKSKISEKLLKDSPYIDSFTQKKTSEFYSFLS